MKEKQKVVDKIVYLHNVLNTSMQFENESKYKAVGECSGPNLKWVVLVLIKQRFNALSIHRIIPGECDFYNGNIMR
jgi:hypothetical protein